MPLCNIRSSLQLYSVLRTRYKYVILQLRKVAQYVDNVRYACIFITPVCHTRYKYSISLDQAFASKIRSRATPRLLSLPCFPAKRYAYKYAYSE